MKRIAQLSFMLMGLFLLASCGSTTDIVGSWEKPGFKESLGNKRVFVVALSQNLPAKQKVEGDLATLFSSNGFTVTKSLDVFPPTMESKHLRDKNFLIAKLKNYNTDLIVTNSVVDKKTYERYYGGGMGPWGGGFWGYWGGYWGGMWGPGFSSTEKVYYLETNIFDARTSELLWSVQTRTDSPSSLNSFIEGYVKTIGKKMAADGILNPQFTQ